MSGGVLDDRVAHLARPALAPGAGDRGRTGLGELPEQLVAGLRQRGDVRDARFGAAEPLRGRRRLQVAGVARELGLDPPDLPAQLPPRCALVGLEPRVVELELAREVAQVELRPLVVERRQLQRLRQGGGDQGGDGDVARVDPRVMRRLDRLGGDPLDLG